MCRQLLCFSQFLETLPTCVSISAFRHHPTYPLSVLTMNMIGWLLAYIFNIKTINCLQFTHKRRQKLDTLSRANDPHRRFGNAVGSWCLFNATSPLWKCKHRRICWNILMLKINNPGKILTCSSGTKIEKHQNWSCTAGYDVRMLWKWNSCKTASSGQ